MNTSEQQAIFAMAITVILSYIYYFTLQWIGTVEMKTTNSMIAKHFLARKIIGFVLLGILPALLVWFCFGVKTLQIKIISGNSSNLWAWLIGVTILLVVINLFNAKNADLRAMYPEMRLQQWNICSLTIAAGGWILYLTGYEYLFRGILFFNCITAFGIWPAITINLMLYSTLHLYKGLKEAIAAIPFGLLLCYITIESNSILPAILIHSVQAISAEISCIYRNKEMKFSFIKNILS